MLLTIDVHNSIRIRYGLNLAVYLDGEEVSDVFVADDAEGYVGRLLRAGDGRLYTASARAGKPAAEVLHGRVTFVAVSEPRKAAEAFVAQAPVVAAAGCSSDAGFHIPVNLPDTPAQVARRYRAAFGDEALERCDEDVARAEAAGLPLRHRFLERTSSLIRREDVRAGLRDEWGDRLPKAEGAQP